MSDDYLSEMSDAPYRILAVDDEAEILNIYDMSLNASPARPGSEALTAMEKDLFGLEAPPHSASQFSLTCRDTGPDGVAEVRAAFTEGQPYAAVLLDKCMPLESDGLRVATQIRAIDPAVTIVLITGDQNDELRRGFRQFISDDRFFVFYKPFYPVELRQFLSAICAKSRLEQKLFLINRTLEERVDQRTASLESARRRAEAATVAKSAFLANVSHDLRTPLNGILGVSALLGQTGLDAEQSEQLATIHRSGMWLLEMIESLLELSSIEAGKLEVELRPVNLRNLIGECIDVVRGAAGEKPIRFEQAIDAGIREEIITDGRMLKQILTNLLGNAVKFSEDGRVAVEVSRTGDAGLRFAVKDDGPGISKEAQAQLFERFWRGDQDRKKPGSGTGLGLAISRQLVELLGGEIGVASEPGAGAQFWFRLPTRQGVPVNR